MAAAHCARRADFPEPRCSAPCRSCRCTRCSWRRCCSGRSLPRRHAGTARSRTCRTRRSCTPAGPRRSAAPRRGCPRQESPSPCRRGTATAALPGPGRWRGRLLRTAPRGGRAMRTGPDEMILWWRASRGDLFAAAADEHARDEAAWALVAGTTAAAADATRANTATSTRVRPRTRLVGANGDTDIGDPPEMQRTPLCAQTSGRDHAHRMIETMLRATRSVKGRIRARALDWIADGPHAESCAGRDRLSRSEDPATGCRTSVPRHPKPRRRCVDYQAMTWRRVQTLKRNSTTSPSAIT